MDVKNRKDSNEELERVHSVSSGGPYPGIDHTEVGSLSRLWSVWRFHFQS